MELSTKFFSKKLLAVGCYIAVCDLGEARMRIFSYVILYNNYYLFIHYKANPLLYPWSCMHADLQRFVDVVLSNTIAVVTEDWCYIQLPW